MQVIGDDGTSKHLDTYRSRDQIQTRLIQTGEGEVKMTNLLESEIVGLIKSQTSNERSDFVGLRVVVRGCSDPVERDKGESTRSFGVHDLDEPRSGSIRVDDDVE